MDTEHIRLIEIPVSILSLQPGDVIVLTLHDGFTFEGEEAEHCLAEVKERFPGHAVLIVHGMDVSVVRAPGPQGAS